MDKAIKFSLEKGEFKKLVKAHSTFALEKSPHDILGAINFKVNADKDLITCASTDGNRLLKTEVDIVVEQYHSGQTEFNFPADFLNKIKLQKGKGSKKGDIDLIEITLQEEFISILDIRNNISYQIPAVAGVFPKYEGLIPNYDKEAAHCVCVNLRFFKDLKNFDVSDRTNLITVTLNKENSLSPILVNSEREGVKSQGLLMPIDLKK